MIKQVLRIFLFGILLNLVSFTAYSQNKQKFITEISNKAAKLTQTEREHVSSLMKKPIYKKITFVENWELLNMAILLKQAGGYLQHCVAQ